MDKIKKAASMEKSQTDEIIPLEFNLFIQSQSARVIALPMSNA
jgi:hypothetical protein